MLFGPWDAVQADVDSGTMEFISIESLLGGLGTFPHQILIQYL
jgi:hypothetical protein